MSIRPVDYQAGIHKTGEYGSDAAARHPQRMNTNTQQQQQDIKQGVVLQQQRIAPSTQTRHKGIQQDDKERKGRQRDREGSNQGDKNTEQEALQEDKGLSIDIRI